MENDENPIDNLKKFGISFQTKILASLLTDKEFLERIMDINNVDYFENDSHKWIIKELNTYFLTYKQIPTLEVFKVKLETVQSDVLKKSIVEQLRAVYSKTKDTDLTFIKEEFLGFCKNQMIKGAILDSVDLLKMGRYDAIKLLVDSAMKAGAERNYGHDYRTGVIERMAQMNRKVVPTGFDVIDQLTDGGLGAGELGVVVAPAGKGKSWVLCRLGANALIRGKNVVHFSLELNEHYVGLRYDACLTEINFQDIRNNVGAVQSKIEELSGDLNIKYFPVKSVSAQSLKAYCDRLIMIGKKIDLVIIDYPDLLRPVESGNNSNSNDTMGGIYEDIRGFAGELQVPVWVASQTNRGGEDDDVIEAKAIADSYKKIMTGDVVLTLSRKLEDKVNGTARFHLLKNRFGADGLTFPAKMDASCGLICIYTDDSSEGIEITNSMKNGETNFKSLLKDRHEKLYSSNKAKATADSFG